MLLPIFTWHLTVLASAQSTVVSARLKPGENTFGAVLFFTYILAALYFIIHIGWSIFRLQAQDESVSKVSDGSDSSSPRERPDRARPARYHAAFRTFSALAFASFAILSWNMLNFLIVSNQRWSTAHGAPTLFCGKSIEQLGHDAYSIWTWATCTNLFQTFAEDLVSTPAQWKVVRAALIYSYTWNAWMSALGRVANVPDLWIYFILDQILPISFTQNLFCVALTSRRDMLDTVHMVEPSSVLVLCLRLASLLCYISTLYWIPSTVNTTQFFPALFAVRILLLVPYLVDRLDFHLRPSRHSSSKLTTTGFNKVLVAISLLAFAQVILLDSNTSWGTSAALGDVNYAAAALSNDMVMGFLGSIAFFYLIWRPKVTPQSH